MGGAKTRKTRKARERGQKKRFASGNGAGQGRATDDYYAKSRHGSGIRHGKKDTGRMNTVHQGLHYGWGTHEAAAESLEPLWEGRGQGWLHGLHQKRVNYLSSSEDTGGHVPSGRCALEEEQGPPVPLSKEHSNGSRSSSRYHEESDGGRKRVKVSTAREEKLSSLETIREESHGSKDRISNQSDGHDVADHHMDDAHLVIDSEVSSSKEGKSRESPENAAVTIHRGISEIPLQERRATMNQERQSEPDPYKDNVSSFSVDDLNRAIIKKNQVLFRKLASGQHLLHSKKSSSMSPLICASRYGDESMVKMLLEVGSIVDIVDASDKTPLMYAIERGNSDIVRTLLDNGASVHRICKASLSALHYAVNNNSDEISEMLIDAGSDLDFKCPLGKTALMKASTSGKARVVVALISSGCSVDIIDNNGRTALMSCLSHGVRSKKIVSALIGAGSVEYLDKVDYDGRSALVHAISNGISTAAEMLLKRGCEFNRFCRFSGKHPLILAIECKQHSCVSWMLRHGANPDCTDKNQKTALMYAAELGYGQMVADLVNAGASIHPTDLTTKFSALDYAAYYGHKQSARILLKEEGKTLPDTQF